MMTFFKNEFYCFFCTFYVFSPFSSIGWLTMAPLFDCDLSLSLFSASFSSTLKILFFYISI